MSNIRYSLFWMLTSVLLAPQLSSQEISLTTGKGQVIPIKKRQVVLDYGEVYLAKADVSETPLASIKAPLQNPFTLIDETAVDLSPAEKGTVTKEVAIVYDEASILKAIAASFSKQVRGTLARGDSDYLQLQGGSLLQSGSSFPARIPQIGGDVTYNVKLSKVSSKSYTLSLGESTLDLQVNSAEGGAVRYRE